MRTSKHRGSERGTQVAELALVLPVILLISLVIAEGSGFIRVHQVLNNAAREGARLATIKDNAPVSGEDHVTPIKQAVATYACNNGVALTGSGFACANSNPSVVCNGATITVVQDLVMPTVPTTSTGSRVTVSCSYQLTYLPAIPWFNIGTAVPLTGSAEFTNFY